MWTAKTVKRPRPWTVTRSSLRMLRRVAAFCRPLRPVFLWVSFPRSRSPVVGVPGLCRLSHGVPFVRQRRPVIGVPGVVLVVAGCKGTSSGRNVTRGVCTRGGVPPEGGQAQAPPRHTPERPPQQTPAPGPTHTEAALAEGPPPSGTAPEGPANTPAPPAPRQRTEYRAPPHTGTAQHTPSPREGRASAGAKEHRRPRPPTPAPAKRWRPGV